MTIRKLEERIGEHLYGWNKQTPKPWADLVPGYDPYARTRAAQLKVVRRIIADGTVFVSYRGECFHWWLKFRESLRIARIGPPFNIQENMNNLHHVPKWRQHEQRVRRDMTRIDASSAGHLKWNTKATSIRVVSGGGMEYYGIPLTSENHERMLEIAEWKGTGV